MSVRPPVVSRDPRALRTHVPQPSSSVQDATAASFDVLEDKLKYLDEAEIRRIKSAYRFADVAHLGQFRTSGEPYITHPIAVAGLCADWGLDEQAIMAALMHDAMEDCGITKSELIERFGAPTAELVDGLTKLDRLKFSTREETQAENFRKMLLAMVRDVRVILVKLADRLHNMRTMESVEVAKRTRIAQETLDIYAPIAHRLGLNQVYRELQDLSFAHLRPWRHAVLAKAVQRSRGYRRDTVERIRQDVEKAFAAAGTPVQVVGREKTLFSIYRKMRDKHLSFAQVNDIFGFRIVVDTLPGCYTALGVLHQLYKPTPGRFQDYIAIPKGNGYQSLHTTLKSPLGMAVEFQIRTEAMHHVAEKGIAAHWWYKTHGYAELPGHDAQRLGAMWLQSLIDIQSETRDAGEFLEHVKIDLFPDAIYVFTPRTEILALPRGACPIDFAYAIHTDVGDHCVGAKVNGEPVALRTQLRSGDVIEIVGAPNARPNPAWLNFVRTGRARSRIRHYLKTMELAESQALGEKMLTQALRAEGYTMPAADTPEAHLLWQQLTRWSGNRNRAELTADIGFGRKMATIVAKRLALSMAERGSRPDAVTLSWGRYASDDAAPAQGLVLIDGSEGASIQLAACCRPIPGDAIVGYLGRGEGLLVHAGDCPVARRLLHREGDSFLSVEWAEQPSRSFETGVRLLMQSGKGVLAKVAQAIAAAEADITHIEMGNSASAEDSELDLLLSVRDRLHLADVMRALHRSRAVLRVSRARPGDAPLRRSSADQRGEEVEPTTGAG